MSDHAKYSPSAMERILSCPASVNLSAGYEDTSSSYAEEGTKAHEDLEQCLIMGTDSKDDYIQEVLDYVARRQDDGMDMVHSESKVSLRAFLDRDDCWGTADIIMHDYGLTEIEICDLKYGQGIVVEPEGNAQLMTYALGALATVTPKGSKFPRKVTLTIAQPRIEHSEGTIRSVEMNIDELMQFKDHMIERLALVDAEEPVYGPSLKACKWCKAKAECSQRAGHNLAELGLSFDPVSPEKLLETGKMSEDQVVQILDSADEIRSWLADVADGAFATMKAGKPVKGYKIVRGRANRKWKDDQETTEAALKALGFKVKEYQNHSLVSPAAIEKVVKARKMKAPKRDAVKAMVEKPESKLTLAHESDSRPAAILARPSNPFGDVSEPEDQDDLASYLM